MKNEYEQIDELIAKVLSGEAKKEELDLVESWKNETPENRTYFAEMQQLYVAIENTEATIGIDTDAAWIKLNHRISDKRPKVIQLFDRRRVLQAAASFLLLISLAFVLKWMFTNTEPTPLIIASTKSTLENKLPDGSKVILNKNTELIYSLNNKNERKVKLKGEAYFEVVHNSEKPFVIEVNEVMVKDIGTAFNVKALPQSNEVEVLVEEGEVQFYTESNTGLRLTKGEKAVYNKISKSFMKLSPEANKNTLSYTSKIFRFENSRLSEVIEELNAVYGCKIELADLGIGKCKLTVVFTNEKLEELLAVIAETLDLKIEKHGETILLQGKPCPD